MRKSLPYITTVVYKCESDSFEIPLPEPFVFRSFYQQLESENKKLRKLINQADGLLSGAGLSEDKWVTLKKKSKIEF